MGLTVMGQQIRSELNAITGFDRKAVSKPNGVMRHICALLVLLYGSGAANAETWRAGASINATETWTDNVGRSETSKQSDWVTQITPSVFASGRGPRLEGSFNASLSNSLHANSEKDNTSSLNLHSNGKLTVVENHVFVDAAASVNRQGVSLFAPTDEGGYGSDTNQAEVRTISVSPSTKFRLGNVGTLEAYYRYSYIDSDNAALSGQQSDGWGASLGENGAYGPMGWFVSASGNSSDNSSGVTASSSSYRGGLTYSYVPDWRFQVFTGRESNHFGSGREESSTIWGGGVQWNPTPRTTISTAGSKHFYGWGYDASIQHRFPRSSITLGASRSIQSLSAQGATGLFTLSSQYAAALEIEIVRIRALRPDLSEQEVTDLAILSLLSRGIVPSLQQISAAYSAYSVSRQIRASWVIGGVRNTIALNVFRTSSDRIESTSFIGLGDLSTFSRVTSTGYLAAWSYRLSPLSALSSSLGVTRASGTAVSGADTNRRQVDFSVGFNTKLGAKTTGVLTYRRSRSSGSASYTENAVSASIAHTF